MALVHRFDGEFPLTYFEECCEYMGCTETEARLILSLWRNKELFDGSELKVMVS